MSPNFLSGDYVIICAWPFMCYRCGDVVVVEHPVYQTIIKRIIKINDAGEFLLQGDHHQSTASEALGWRSRNEISGKVIWHIPSRKLASDFQSRGEV